MESWILMDLAICLMYGLQHTLLTTKVAVDIYNKALPDYTWNFVYSSISVATLIVGFIYWEASGVYLFHFVPGSFAYHVSTALLALSLFLFFIVLSIQPRFGNGLA